MAKLPVLDMPTFEIKLLSVANPVRFRQFTVREEKIFLIAEESGEEREVINALGQVLQNCCISDINVSTLPLFDVEYFFLQLRARSVNNVSNLRYRDKEDGIVRDFDVDLDTIVPAFNPEQKKSFQISDKIAISLNFPTLETLLTINKLNVTNVDSAIEMVAACIDVIVDGEETYIGADFSQEEKVEFINNLNSKQYEEIVNDFLDKMPKLTYDIKYVNEKGNNRLIKLEGYRDFFQ